MRSHRLPAPPALLLALAAAVLLAAPVWGQTCRYNVTLSSQAQVDAFACEVVTRTLTVQGPDITSLAPLSRLTSVGRLTITGNTALTSLDGLGALERVTGYSVSSWLSATRYYNGSLTVTGNPELVSLDGLGALNTVKELVVSSNASLTSLGELSELASVGGLTVTDNPALTSLGELSKLASVGALTVTRNPQLASLDGLGALKSVTGYWARSLSGDSSFRDGYLTITDNAALTSLGELGALAFADGLTITGNPVLASLDGLGALASVRKRLFVTDNTALASLGGLGALTSVGDLRITGNAELTSLDGLGALEEVTGYWVRGYYSNYFRGGSLTVHNNAALKECSCGLTGVVDDDRTAFSGVVSTVTISGNLSEAAGGVCTSPSAVLATPCGSGAVEPVACSVTAPVSFDADGSSGDGSAVDVADFSTAGAESVAVRHEGAEGDAPVDLSGCSLVTFDPFAETAIASVAAAGELAPGAAHAFATTGGNQPLPPDALYDDPGAFALVTGTVQAGDDVSTVFGRVVAAVVYDRDGSVYASTRGGLSGDAATAQAQTFAAAMARVFGGQATSAEGEGGVDLAVRTWPNPSPGAARVAFGLAEGGAARVSVVDALGREVAVVADGPFGPGRHKAAVAGLPAGVYVVRVASAEGVRTTRLTVAR